MSLNGLLIEEETGRNIELFLRKVTGGLILLGDKGIGKSPCAKQIASSILKCSVKELEIHPDYYYVESIKDVVGIEQIHDLRSRCGMVAAKGEHKVFVIDDAEKMTEAAQNAILKVLEDGNRTNIIIFVTNHALLSTIHSRCTVIKFKKPSENQMRTYLEKNNQAVDEVAISMADGRVGFYYQLLNEPELLDCLKEIIHTFNSMNEKRELLQAFHMLKEKDKDCFFEKFEMQYVIAFMQLIKEMFTDLIISQYGREVKYSFFDEKSLKRSYSTVRMISIVSQIENDLLRMRRKGAYSKNDFFDLVRNMV